MKLLSYSAELSIIKTMLDIVIPTLNESKNLIKLLPFLQEHLANRAVNIIVVDSNQSTDDTASICLQYDVKYIRSQHTQRSIQLNEGAGLTQGKIILFLHADVLPPSNLYEEITTAIEEQYDAGFFAYVFDSPKWILKVNAFFTRFDGFFAGGGDQCQFVKRSVFQNLGGYEEKLTIMEDFQFYDRLKKANIPYKLIKTPAKVSARKYEHNTYLKVNLANLLVFIGYKLHLPPTKLKQSYSRWLR